MTISGTLNELQELKAEAKRLSARLKIIRKQINEKDVYIQEYLQSKQQPGLKFQGQAYVLKEATKRVPKKKNDREEDSIRVLQAAGVDNPEKVLIELLEARKGESQAIQKLKIEKLKI